MRLRIFLLSLLIFVMPVCTAAYAVENEGETVKPEYDLGHGWVYGADYVAASPEAESNIRKYFRFELIEEQPAEGDRISSFDVSDGGRLVLTVHGGTIWVIDENGRFDYGYRFSVDGACSAVWSADGEYIVFCYVRGDGALVLSRQGEVLKSYRFTEDYLKRTHYTHKDIMTRKRESDGYTYATDCTRKHGTVTDSVVRIDAAGNSRTLFTMTYTEPISDLGRLAIFLVSCPIVYLLIVIYRRRHGMSIR